MLRRVALCLRLEHDVSETIQNPKRRVLIKDKVVDNVQNCESYFNVLSSQTCRSYSYSIIYNLLFIVFICLFDCICYLYCINAATRWTTNLQFSDNDNNIIGMPLFTDWIDSVWQ
jgi:hypothetical protein